MQQVRLECPAVALVAEIVAAAKAHAAGWAQPQVMGQVDMAPCATACTTFGMPLLTLLLSGCVAHGLQSVARFKSGMAGCGHVLELHYNAALLAHRQGDLQEALSQVGALVCRLSLQ